MVFGSATVEGGDTTLSLRAKYLTQEDAETILDDAADRFEASA